MVPQSATAPKSSDNFHGGTGPDGDEGDGGDEGSDGNSDNGDDGDSDDGSDGDLSSLLPHFCRTAHERRRR